MEYKEKASVLENKPAGTFVLQVHADDADEGEPMEKSHMVLCIKTARFLPSALIQKQVIIQVHLFNKLIPCSMYAQLLY